MLDKVFEIQQQSRSYPPWHHTDMFDPLLPSPVFEGVWHGKGLKLKEYFFKCIPYNIFEVISICTNVSSFGYPRIKMYWAVGTRVDKMMLCKHLFSVRNALKFVVVDDDDVSNDMKIKVKFWKIHPLFGTVRAGCLLNL